MGRDLVLVLALALATVAAYWPVGRHDFVAYDDDRYVADNRHVRDGFSRAGLRWAATTYEGDNWHPVTWLSHMLDGQLFGRRAGGHHLTNLWLHVLNTALLFALLRRMTGSRWRSALVAALFALHPLHVESVAWVAERKDVLSTFFGLLALHAWAGWVARPGPARYGLVVLSFALALLSKPMLVTLPAVMLLLDAWPLGRLGAGPGAAWALVREKVPLFLLSIACAAVTVVAQHQAGAMRTLEEIGLGARLATAVVGWARYLVAMVWPVDLAVLYPHPGHWPAGAVAGAAALLALVSLLVAATWRRRPALAVGWLWYLGTLVPVIGLVQVGVQSHADRYTYLPLVGVFVMAAWSLGRVDVGRPRRRVVAAVGATALVATLLVLTRLQLRHWRDSRALFERAVRVTSGNAVAHSNLGVVLRNAGDIAGAVRHFEEAIRIDPRFAGAHANLAEAFAVQGRHAEAAKRYRAALHLDPDLAVARNGLAGALVREGRLEQAAAHLRAALRREPGWPDGHYNLGLVLAAQGRPEEAQAAYGRALALDPAHAAARAQLAATRAADP
jgi:tetratricopeptide (TPR) repeat protein